MSAVIASAVSSIVAYAAAMVYITYERKEKSTGETTYPEYADMSNL
jgi:hypothetical protein